MGGGKKNNHNNKKRTCASLILFDERDACAGHSIQDSFPTVPLCAARIHAYYFMLSNSLARCPIKKFLEILTNFKDLNPKF